MFVACSCSFEHVGNNFLLMMTIKEKMITVRYMGMLTESNMIRDMSCVDNCVDMWVGFKEFSQKRLLITRSLPFGDLNILFADAKNYCKLLKMIRSLLWKIFFFETKLGMWF